MITSKELGYTLEDFLSDCRAHYQSRLMEYPQDRFKAFAKFLADEAMYINSLVRQQNEFGDYGKGENYTEVNKHLLALLYDVIDANEVEQEYLLIHCKYVFYMDVILEDVFSEDPSASIIRIFRKESDKLEVVYEYLVDELGDDHSIVKETKQKLEYSIEAVEYIKYNYL